MTKLNVPAKTYVALDLVLDDETPRVIKEGIPVFMWGEEVGKLDSYLVGTSNIAVLIIPNGHTGACQQFMNWPEDIKSVEIATTQITVIM